MKPITEQYAELMHYTNIGGLMGIVATGCLWATHASFLNDASEMKHYYDARLPQVVTEVMREAAIKLAHSSEAAAEAMTRDGGIEHVATIEAAAAARSLRSVTLPFTEAYVFAMSAATDDQVASSGLLSQWRGYGRDGGYCIVLDTARLEDLLRRESEAFHYQHIHWGDVYYDGRTANQPSTEDVAEAEVTLRAGIANWIEHGGVEETPGFLQAITMLSCLYKHRGFFEEHEVRIVAIPMKPEVLEQMTATQREAKATKPILAASRSGIAVPYLELCRDLRGIDGPRQLPITRVIVGPHSDGTTRINAIERLLIANGYDAEVSGSDIPYIGR